MPWIRDIPNPGEVFDFDRHIKKVDWENVNVHTGPGDFYERGQYENRYESTFHADATHVEGFNIREYLSMVMHQAMENGFHQWRNHELKDAISYFVIEEMMKDFTFRYENSKEPGPSGMVYIRGYYRGKSVLCFAVVGDYMRNPKYRQDAMTQIIRQVAKQLLQYYVSIKAKEQMNATAIETTAEVK